MSKASSSLEKYLPPGSLELTMALLRTEPVQLTISRPRKTKFGDYRFPKNNERHRISINANLNTYAFLITLIHEMAHLKAFLDFGRQIKPHGREWQETFKQLAKPFLQAEIFPTALQIQLIKSLNKGAASSCSDLGLFRELKQYDITPSQLLTVEQIEEGKHFKIENNKIFRKGPKSRTRYRCRNIHNGRDYMVHPLAEVQIVEDDKISKSA